MKNSLKNKIILITAIFLILLSYFFAKPVSAYNIDNSVDFSSVNLEDFGIKKVNGYYSYNDNVTICDDYFITYSNYFKKYLIYFVKSGGYFTDTAPIYYYLNDKSNINCMVFLLTTDFTSCNNKSIETIDSTSFGENDKICKSTFDLKNQDGTVFFQAPLPQTLSQIMEVEGERKTIQKEIVGLLPLILVVVVSFLGLRKALKMLATFFHRS